MKIGDYIQEQDDGALELQQPQQMEGGEVVESGGGFDIIGLLKSPTGEGEIDDYMQHVLNFNESRGMARIIRGLTGMLGNLNYAIVDIACGVLELMKGRRKVVHSVE